MVYCSIECAHKYKPSRNWNIARNYKYKQNYGIDLEFYNKLFAEQNGCCAICKRHQSEFKMRLCVDHNHKTGEIRGLLCHPCNHAIGLFKENPVTIQAAKEYVS